ncbi:MAG TPA: hypothetical protein VML96_01700 [Egibacteraceae bacterium]|nr:hypothetical protein [Egibacteraceae bacterium]
MIPASPEEQRRLVELQRVDTAIRQLAHRRSNLPEQQALDENADTLSRVSAELSSARERSERLASQQRRHEDEISAVDSRRKSEEGRMYSGLITSERELEALRSELGSLKARKNALEDALLEIMEQREELDSLVATLTQRQDELSGSVAALTSARDAAATDIDAELSAREAERRTVAADLPGDVVELYDELRARKQGVGVAELHGRTCMGCRLELTAIEMEETKEAVGSGLARCPQCGRIIVLA